MKVSIQTVNYLNEKYGCSSKISDIDDIVHRIGVQLGAVEEVEDWGKYYDGIIVAKVVSCEKHPDADKLSVCMIDDGGRAKDVERDNNNNVRVVCGAPNVRAGLTVAWLPPGTTVPSTVKKDPFVLEAREIRGVISNGMLASPAELNLSDNHEGILEIDAQEVGEEFVIPGTSFKNLYGLDDVIIDCENKMFTHRPDCFGILGVARELAGIQGLAFKSPDWYIRKPEVKMGEGLPLQIKVEDTDLVPRLMAVTLKDVSVGPSPIWLQAFLTRVGIKSINNVVDMTNYYMQLTGQPLHAYDYDKVAKLSGTTPVIMARQAKKGERIALLNGKTVEFDSPAIVIATDKQAIGVGGVMGGSETEVDETTNNIILECATFDMYNIRRTSMKYGLFTDAVTRFTKGQSPLQNYFVICKVAQDISEQTGAKLASEIFDVRSEKTEKLGKFDRSTLVTSEFINERLGTDLSNEKIIKLLTNVEIDAHVAAGSLCITPPYWRTDIELPEDVVEEVGRLYGYNKLPVVLPKRDLAPANENNILNIKSTIRTILSNAGANEVLTYSFVHGDLLTKVGQDKEMAIELSNALSPELQYYRLSLLPSLLDKVHANIKAGHSQFAIFEINKSHCKDYVDKDGLPIEEQRLAFVFVADAKTQSSDYSGAPYYIARKYMQYLLAELGFTARFESAIDHNPKLNVSKAAFAPFEPKRSAIVKDKNGEFIGEIGEFRSSVRKNLKLPEYVAGFELDVLQLLKLTRNKSYSPLSRFPSTDQDISLQVDASTSYESVFDVVWQRLAQAESEHGYEVKLSPVDIYQQETSNTKNITLRVTLTHHDRTLVTDEVSSLMDSVAAVAHKKLGAIRL